MPIFPKMADRQMGAGFPPLAALKREIQTRASLLVPLSIGQEACIFLRLKHCRRPKRREKFPLHGQLGVDFSGIPFHLSVRPRWARSGPIHLELEFVVRFLDIKLLNNE